MRRDITSLLCLVASTVVVASGCASRNPVAAVPPPAAPSEPTASEVLAESRDRALSGEARLDEGDVAVAESEFREAIAALELYLDRTRGTGNGSDEGLGPQLIEELTRLRVRLDSLRALTVGGRNGIDGPIEVVLRPEVAGLPLSEHPSVLARLEYYTEGPGRSTIEVGLERLGLYETMLRRVLREEGVPEGLLYLAQAESTFKPEALSSSAARGMWQFMAPRGEEYGLRQNRWIDERSDPEKSTRAAARHLRDLYERFGDWYLAMAAYNAGPAGIERAVRDAGANDFWALADSGQLSAQARDYVPTILAMAIIGAAPSEWGFDVLPAPELDTVRIPVAEATDLRVIAGQLGIPVEEVQRLNPHVLGWATPPEDAEFELVLPKGYEVLFEARVGPLPENQRILFRHHEVSSGETLSYIARLYEVPVAAIVDSNGLSDPDAIRIGESLIIPVSGVARPPDADAGVAPARAAASEGLPGVTNQAIIYSVQAGDTLTRIASVFGTSVEALLEWNPGSDLSVIYPGDEITIPGGFGSEIE
jgi:membrane-bound lytic murein transglycosylase D